MVFCSGVGELVLNDKPMFSFPENHSFLCFEVTEWATLFADHFSVSEDFFVFVAGTYFVHSREKN